MEVLKIKKRSEPAEGNEDFAYSHFFGVRIKSGFLSCKDVSVLIYTNRPEISIDEIVNAIESQEESIRREIFPTLYSKNKVAAMFLGKNSFTTKIGGDDCKFCFCAYEPIDYQINNPSNWKKYKR